jgi:hypothetical protein
MTYWDVTVMSLIYQIYGLSFFMLGTVISLLPKHNHIWNIPHHLPWLAAFGFLHEVMEFVEMQRLFNSAEWLTWLSRTLLLASFLLLLEFGRRITVDVYGSVRLSSPLVYGTVIIGMAALVLSAHEPLIGLIIGSRWFVGVPGALLTGIALFNIERNQRNLRLNQNNSFWLQAIAMAFICYGLFTFILANSDQTLPKWILTQADFIDLLGVPVQLFRSICAVTITVGFFVMLAKSVQNFPGPWGKER